MNRFQSPRTKLLQYPRILSFRVGRLKNECPFKKGPSDFTYCRLPGVAHVFKYSEFIGMSILLDITRKNLRNLHYHWPVLMISQALFAIHN